MVGHRSSISCPYCHSSCNSAPWAFVRVLEVLSYDDYNWERSEWDLKAFGLLERREWLDPPPPHVAVTFECNNCKLRFDKPNPALPESVYRDLEELLACVNIGAWKAMAVMARRILEDVTTRKGLTKGPLAKRLRHLLTEGKLTEPIAGWAEATRKTGNVGAHSGFHPTQEQGMGFVLLPLAFVQAVFIEEPEKIQIGDCSWRTVWDEAKCAGLSGSDISS